MQPYRGDGHFQWSMGGWFGTQIGSTAWLVFLGIALAFVDILGGLVLLVCGFIPNIVGYMMWRRRDRLAPYPAMRKLIATVFLFTVIALGYGNYYCYLKDAEYLSRAKQSVMILLIFPVAMLIFHYQEQNGRRLRAQQGGGEERR